MTRLPMIFVSPDTEKQGDESGGEVRLTAASLPAKMTGVQKLGVNSTHRQAVGQVAEPLQVIARSDDGVAESMQLKPKLVRMLPFLSSVQFHPERLTDRYPEQRAIFAAFTQVCVWHRERKL